LGNTKPLGREQWPAGIARAIKRSRGGSYRARGEQERQACGGRPLGDSKSDKRVRICGEASFGDKNTSNNLGRRNRRHQTANTRARKKQRRVGEEGAHQGGRSAQRGIARGDALCTTLLRWVSASRAVGSCVCESVGTSCSTQVGDWETPSAPPSKTLRQSQTRSYPRRSSQAGES
jgi:hypothetical protein